MLLKTQVYVVALFFGLILSASVVNAQATNPTLEKRIQDLEAYVNNTARVTETGTSKVSGPGPGHNGWMMVATALVLFMTLPGLALFYGGLVRSKNILSVLAQCFGIAGLVTILWWAVGYSLAFSWSNYDANGAGMAGSTILGSLKFAFFDGVDSMPNGDYSAWISHNVFSMYQMMFAIITPALIIGAIAERMKYSALMLFVVGWMFIVYFPMAHMVWGIDGAMNGIWNPNASIKAIDFAGGTVVHMTSGWSALVLCLILGKRLGFGVKNMSPHNLVLTMIGTGMLWVGWYGFNAGSALASDTVSSNAFTTTTLATATAAFVWPLIEWILKGKPTVLGFCSGAVAGLVVVTPACGFINTKGAMIIGVLAGTIPFFAVYKLKIWLGYDDALDTFGVHAVGGTLGALLTGILAVSSQLPDGTPNPLSVNGNMGNVNALINGGMLWLEQLKAIGITLGIAIVGSTALAYLLKFTIGLRPVESVEIQGLDVAEHGEEGYNGFQLFVE